MHTLIWILLVVVVIVAILWLVGAVRGRRGPRI